MPSNQARPAWPLLRSSWLLVVLCQPVWAAQFLNFQAVSNAAGSDVVGGGAVILRLRPGMRVNGGAAALAAHLNRLAFAGLTPANLDVRTLPAGTQIMASGKPLLTVDKETARIAGATPASVAASWLANLKAVLLIPYVVLEPRDRLLVPLGETRQLRWGGTAAADISFTIAAPGIAGVQLAEAGGALTVQALAPGSTTLAATLDGASTQLPVEVKAWAARVVCPAVAEVTSPPLPFDDLRRTLRNAVLCALRPAPGASIELGEPRAGNGGYLLPLQIDAVVLADVVEGPGATDLVVHLRLLLGLEAVRRERWVVAQALGDGQEVRVRGPVVLGDDLQQQVVALQRSKLRQAADDLLHRHLHIVQVHHAPRREAEHVAFALLGQRHEAHHGLMADEDLIVVRAAGRLGEMDARGLVAAVDQPHDKTQGPRGEVHVVPE